MSDEIFPRLYAAYVAQFRDDLPLWQSLATSTGDPILELGCGPGRVLYDLANKGFSITGLDNDASMLAWARNHVLPQFPGQIELIQADMRNFKLNRQFPLILLPCNTFAYFDDTDAIQVLNCVEQHLTANGRFAFVVPNPGGNLPPHEMPSESKPSTPEFIAQYIEPISHHPVQVFSAENYEEENTKFHVTWSFDELSPDGRVQRVQLKTAYYLRSKGKTIDLFDEIDLAIIYTFGDYECGTLDSNSEDMIFIVRGKSKP